MFEEEKTLTLRVNLVAGFPEDYDGDDDGYAWLHDWETRIKPELIRTVITSLRAHPSWSVHVRNRGMAATDEVEFAVQKTFSTDGRPLPE